jgi:hypothetical protein
MMYYYFKPFLDGTGMWQSWIDMYNEFAMIWIRLSLYWSDQFWNCSVGLLQQINNLDERTTEHVLPTSILRKRIDVLRKRTKGFLSHFQRVLLDYIHARSTNGVLKITCYFLFQILGYYHILYRFSLIFLVASIWSRKQSIFPTVL